MSELGIEKHVLFINKYLSLNILLDYLQRTDIYLFTSKDPQQAVSGTLAYAMSAACPVISTPIPHSLELLDGAGINFDFQNIKKVHEMSYGDLQFFYIQNHQLLIHNYNRLRELGKIQIEEFIKTINEYN